MTAQGKHRPQPRTELVPFVPLPAGPVLEVACQRLQQKGYEIRALRLHMEDHGRKATVVLHLSPGPSIYKRSKSPQSVGQGWNGKYSGQNVGTTRRRNIETLLAYVEGLPDVRRDVPDGDGPLSHPV
jgi:hypothetical protein